MQNYLFSKSFRLGHAPARSTSSPSVPTSTRLYVWPFLPQPTRVLPSLFPQSHQATGSRSGPSWSGASSIVNNCVQIKAAAVAPGPAVLLPTKAHGTGEMGLARRSGACPWPRRLCDPVRTRLFCLPPRTPRSLFHVF